MLFVDGGSNRVIVGAAGGLTSTFNVSGNAQFSNGTGNVGSLSIAPSNDRQLITANSPGNYGDYGVTLKSMRATGGSAYINNIDMTYQGTVLNEEGLDVDFRVESGVNANSILVNGETGGISFGTTVTNMASNHNNVAGLGIANNGKVEMATTSNETALEVSKNEGTDGSVLYLRKQSTGFATHNVSSGNYLFGNPSSDKDVIITGNDGGVAINALTLDMSEAGEATFNGDIRLNDGKVARFGTDQDFRIGFDGTNAVLQNVTSDSDITFLGKDGASTITALTLDMSDAGYATFNSGLNSGGVIELPQKASFPATGFVHYTNSYLYAFGGVQGSIFKDRTGVNEFLKLQPSQIVFNEDGGDMDFRVESDTNTHMLFVDGGNNRVGVAQSAPQEPLHATGRILSTTTYGGSTQRIGTSIGQNGNTRADIDFRRWTGASTNHGVGMIEVADTGIMRFYVDSVTSNTPATTERISLDPTGAFTTTPAAGGHAVFNEGGADVDFRVESDTKTHAFFVEGAGAAANQLRIGMGTGTITNPYAQTNFTDLNIDGVWGGVISFKLGGTERGWIGQRNSGNGGMVLSSSSGNSLYLNSGGNTSRMEFTSAGDVVVNPTGVDNDFRVQSDALTHALFVDGGTNHVGMGTATLNRSGLGVDHIVLTVGADTEMGMLELQGTRTSDADLGRIAFLNAGTRRAEIVAARIDADNSTKLYFQTSNAGSLGTRLTIGKDGAATFASDVLPATNGTQDLGSTGKRWANVYTGDLHLSNEEKGGNDVDGTTGNWTIQEGAENLYIKNNKTGKQYKFALEEIV
jgi:hypothetical protein